LGIKLGIKHVPARDSDPLRSGCKKNKAFFSQYRRYREGQWRLPSCCCRLVVGSSILRLQLHIQSTAPLRPHSALLLTPAMTTLLPSPLTRAMEIHRWGSIIELSSVSIQSLKMRRRHVDRLRVPGLRRGEEDRRRRASSDLIDGVRHASCTSRSQMSSRASARLAPEGTSGGGGASFSFRTPPANYLFVRVCAVSGATPWKGNKQQTHSA
jgi:hypothetical protein